MGRYLNGAGTALNRKVTDRLTEYSAGLFFCVRHILSVENTLKRKLPVHRRLRFWKERGYDGRILQKDVCKESF